ncbi:ChbG/HpnK family deacetylase [Methylotenera sp. 1P/1]|jgi:predicted glycoside hydrolase/deacetylase ChbG (UPF0249 family)|uniref:ChbG/HpnK family deacetylase n=1 Tax=Methylotenera sp. 1P/1 TaxID=1131551 RepID=UPI00036F8031|nr:ChbG/HpnK family deacetylase [Methylotenera sp. 1P/1]
MTTLIITADDYAQSAAIDTGILNLVGMGRVTAFSCLTLSTRWPEAATRITQQIKQSADIGLHLDFTQYTQPLKHGLAALILKTKFRLLDESAIRHAIKAQLDAFEQALGMAPDYIDGHQHVHQLPQIRKVLIQELMARYPTRLPWLRIAVPPLADGVKGMIIRWLGASTLQELASLNGVRYTNTLLGVYGFDVDALAYQSKLDGWIQAANAIHRPVAVMCHPAEGTSFTDATDPILTARLHEYAALSSPQFATLIARHNVSLSRGSSAALDE